MSEFDFIRKKMKLYSILCTIFLFLFLLFFVLSVINRVASSIFILIWLFSLIVHLILRAKFIKLYRKFNKINDIRIAINSSDFNNDNH